MARVVVVGGGVGGLCAAIRLAGAGHEVTVCERRGDWGGKLDVRRHDGFVFDTGPSLLTLPQVFDEVFRVGGSSLAEAVELVRLEPAFRYRFADGAGFDVHDDDERTVASIEAMSPGSGAEYRAFLERGEQVWDVARRTFFAGSMDDPWALIGRLRRPADLLAIDPLATLAGRAARTFSDPRMRIWAGRYATYTGSSPWLAPATLACIPAIEVRYGCWYVQGGLGALRDALVALAGQVGVELRARAEVDAVEADGGRVRGVRLAGDEHVAADIVVTDVDALHLFADLLDDQAALRAARRAPRSSSGFALLVGVEGETPLLAHHNVAFSADQAAEFDDLFHHRQPPVDPTVYVCCSARTDPTQAPPGAENWFVLVNAPARSPGGGGINWERQAGPYRDHVLEVLAHRGWDLSGRIRTVEVITPDDLARRYRSPDGAIYGSSSNGRRAAFLRPANRGPRTGLYLVGGSTHPGGGLPLVAAGAAIVARLVEHDLDRGRI